MIPAISMLLAIGCGHEQGFVDRFSTNGIPPAPPFAIAGPSQRIHRHDEVSLDGWDSYDPDDPRAELTYQWEVTYAPPEADWELTNHKTAEPTFVTDTLGTYFVVLVVTDEYDVPSRNPMGTAIEVVPWENLEIILTWDVPGTDLDLHLIAPGGDYYSKDDCFYGNPEPDWGEDGDERDNPVLAQDDEGESRRETISLSQPFDGTYDLVVHHFNRKEAEEVGVTPELQIFAEDEEIDFVTGPLLEEGEVWTAGSFDWTTLHYVESDDVNTHAGLGGPPVNE